jgi:hypothetical protein
MSPRVRNTQAFTLRNQLAIGDEVKIESAIRIALVTAHPPVGFLNTQ